MKRLVHSTFRSWAGARSPSSELRRVAVVCAILGASVLLMSVLGAARAEAGASTHKRASCKTFAKYRVSVDINQWSYSFSTNGTVTWTVTSLCSKVDKGCGFAEAECNATGSCGAGHAYAKINSSGSTKQSPDPCWLVDCGTAFRRPQTLLADTIGASQAEIDNVAEIDSVNGNTLIDNFSGQLAAPIGTRHGVVYRAILWRSVSSTDTQNRPEKVLWDASVRIENSQVITTGGFSAGDFVVTDVPTGLGYTLRQVTPAPGLVKSINPGGDSNRAFTLDNSDNRIELAQFVSSGFGSYDDQFPFAPNPAAAPLTSPVLMAGIAVMLVASGAVAIRRRARSIDRSRKPA